MFSETVWKVREEEKDLMAGGLRETLGMTEVLGVGRIYYAPCCFVE